MSTPTFPMNVSSVTLLRTRIRNDGMYDTLYKFVTIRFGGVNDRTCSVAASPYVMLYVAFVGSLNPVNVSLILLVAAGEIIRSKLLQFECMIISFHEFVFQESKFRTQYFSHYFYTLGTSTEVRYGY